MKSKVVEVNRAPVLTLWAAVVAQRRGHDWDAALSLGKAVAGLNAQSKGRRLGIYASKPEGEEAGKPAEKPRPPEELRILVCGRPVPAKQTREGLRAISGDKAIDPDSVEAYLKGKLGESYGEVRTAMESLAAAYEPEALEGAAFGLYERFRPQIPEGKAGWGQKGRLDLALIEKLAGGKSGRPSRGPAKKG
jgi:hypothetical protein